MSSRSSCTSDTTRRVGVDLDLVGPRDDDLVGARHALARCEPGTRVDDRRAPAERLRDRAERLGDVACADCDEPRRRRTASAKTVRRLLAQPGARRRLVVPALADSFAGDDDVARAAFDRRWPVERLDEDVDLSAARKPDAPRLLVFDPVRDDLGRLAGQHCLRTFADVCLDATAGDRSEHPAGRRHRELRPERAWGAAPRPDDGRQRDLLTGRAPFLRLDEHFVHIA